MRQTPTPIKDTTPYVIESPVGVDRIVKVLQADLNGLAWLEKSFNRAVLMTNIDSGDNQRIIPKCWVADGKDEFEMIANDNWMAYSFFYASGNESPIDYELNEDAQFNQTLSLYIWVNLDRVDDTKTYDYLSELTKEVLDIVNVSTFNDDDYIELNDIDSNALTVYNDFSVDIDKTQLIYYPYRAVRIDFDAYYRMGSCIPVDPQSIRTQTDHGVLTEYNVTLAPTSIKTSTEHGVLTEYNVIIAGEPILVSTDSGSFTEYGVAISGGGAYDSETALEFDGINDNGDLTGNDITLGDTFSVSFWLKPTTGWSGGEAILGKNFNDNIQFEMINTGVDFAYSNGSSSITWNLPTPVTIANGFTHVAIIKTAIDKIRVYSNAVESSDGEQTVDIGDFTFDKVGRKGSSVDLLHGILDDIVIWDGVALTDTQVSDIYNSGDGVDPSTIESNPYVWWKLNGTGTDSTAIDSGSLGEDFILQNFPTSGMWVDGFTT